jgi:hypothetical protein
MTMGSEEDTAAFLTYVQDLGLILRRTITAVILVITTYLLLVGAANSYFVVPFTALLSLLALDVKRKLRSTTRATKGIR